MKKLITGAVAALALLFGFASCSGDLHDVSLIDLSNYAVIGSLNDFSNTANPLTKNADGTYSATWTAVCSGQTSKGGAGETFAIIEQGDGTWGTAYRLAQPKSDGDAANVFSADNNEQKVYQGQSADCMLIPNDMVSKGDTVKLTITPDATFITVKVSVEKSDVPAAPQPYYLDGMYLVGGVFNVDGSSANTWSFSSENLIWGATTSSQTGVVTYTKDVTATATEGEMGINDSTWKNKQLGSGVTIAADAAEPKILDGEEGNFEVTGLTVGEPYRVEITTTPEKVVSVKIFKIAKVTLSFKITGLTEGDSAWVNGSVWGSAWPQGWPIKAWNGETDEKNVGTTDRYIAAHPAAVADSDGVATFDSSWNTTFIAKLGDTMKWSCKVVYIEDGADWDADDAVQDSGDDLQFEYEVTAGGAYTFVIDAANGWEISVE